MTGAFLLSDVPQIYMINLERRRDRYKKMEKIFKVMNIEFKHVKAVDGRYVSHEDR